MADVLRCLIVDDNEAFLAVAEHHLAGDGIDVVGTASSQAQALLQAEALQPDVVLVDVNLGNESGFEVTRRLVERFPQRLRGRVLLISTHDEDDLIDLIAASPAAGFISKDVLSARAIRSFLNNGSPTTTRRSRPSEESDNSG